MFKNLIILSIGLVTLFSCSKLGLKPEPVKSATKFFKPIWIKNMDVSHDTGNLPIGLQSPVIEEGILYIGNNSGSMEAYEALNGRKVWSEKESGDYHAAPIVYKQMVIYGNVEGRLFSRDRFSGNLLYSVDVGAAVESQPQLFNGRLLVHTRNHKVVCLDALTGKILWAYKRSVPFLTTLQRVSRPLVRDNKVYVGFADGFVAAFSIEEGILLWETKAVDGPKFIDVDTQPIFYGKNIVVGSQSGPMTVINPAGGLIMRRVPYNLSRAPITYKGNLILGTAEGEVVILDNDFKVIASKTITTDGITGLALWKDHLTVATTGGELVSLSMDLKREIERFDFGHANSALFGRLVVREEKLAAYSSRNRLYVFQ